MIPWLDRTTPFPSIDLALLEPNGLLCAGGDLSAQRLMDAYQRGIFPWYANGEPILWWSTDPRMVLFTDAFRLHRSLRKFRPYIINGRGNIEPCFGSTGRTEFGTNIKVFETRIGKQVL